MFYLILRRLDVAILKFSNTFCRLDLFGQEVGHNKLTQMMLRWPNLFPLLAVYSIMNNIRALYYHYGYDYYAFQLILLDRAHQAAGYADNSTQLRSYLADQLELKRRDLQRIGSPFVSAPPFSAECSYLAWLGYTAVVCASLFMNFRAGRLRTNFIRLLECPLKEHTRLVNRALQVVNKYLESNYNFKTNNHLTESIDQVVTGTTKSSSSSSSSCSLLQPPGELDYKQNVEMLLSMLNKGELIGLHTFGADWTDRTMLFHCVLFFGFHLFYTLVAIVILNYLFNRPIEGSSTSTIRLNEIHGIANIIINLFTYVFIGLSIAIILLVDWRDQLKKINRLGRLIVDCTNTNNELFCGLKSSRRANYDNEQRLAMNANLLFVLINYKIFSLEAKQALNISGDGANMALRILFTLPIVVRLHAAYCPQEVLLWFVSVCLCAWIFTCSLMLVSCHLNDKTIRLHKPLASLLAHAVQINEAEQGTPVYSRHTLWCLRQELKDLNRFQEASLPRKTPMNVNFTFPVLVKVQFWFNLLLLSIFARTKIKNPLDLSESERFLNDPLRLFGDSFEIQ